MPLTCTKCTAKARGLAIGRTERVGQRKGSEEPWAETA